MRISRRVLGLILASSVAAASARGETNPPPREVLVTAARDRREVTQTPANVTVLTGEAIRRSGASTVGDALKRVGGVQVRSVTGTPTTLEVNMRGFGENGFGRVLVLVDGCRANRPDMANINWLQFPLSNVERVEIVRGPANVLYGDNANAGVINIITRREHAAPGAQAEVETGSFNTLVLRGSASGSAGGSAGRLSAERFTSDGYRDRSRFESSGGAVALDQDLGERVNAGLSVAYQAIDSEWPGALTREQMHENRRQSVNPDDDGENDYLTARATLGVLAGAGQRADLALAYSRTENEINMASWSSFTDSRLDSIGILPKYTRDDTILGHANRLVAGVDAYRDELDVDRFAERRRGEKLIAASVRKQTVGGYARNEHNLTPALVLELGGRVETATFDADARSAGATLFDKETSHDVTAADVSLIRTFADRSRVFARAATLYRYPFVDEQVSYYGYGTDAFYADIDPEHGWSAEVGGEWQVAAPLSVGVTLYRMELRDEIAYNLASYRNENLDDTRHQGVEVDVTWRPAALVDVAANYTFADSAFTDGPNDGKDIPLVSSHKASGTLGVNLPGRLRIESTVTYVAEAWLGSDNQNSGEQIPSYTVVDAQVRHTPAGARGVEAFVAVDNVLDEEYETLGYYSSTGGDWYYPAAGRAVKAGVRYAF